MSLLQIIERFVDADLRDEAGRRVAVELGPPVDATRRAEIEATLGPLPDDVRALYDRCGWLDERWLEPCVDFTEAERDFADIFDRCVRLGGDGLGNFWVVDVDPTGAWGPVFFACHDPPAIVVQAPDLEEFLQQLLHGTHASDDPMSIVHDEATMRAWRDKHPGLSVEHARASDDPELEAFATRFEPPVRIVDLRAHTVGEGWSLSRPILARKDLLFALGEPSRKSWLARLLRL